MIKRIRKNNEKLSKNFISNEFCCPCCDVSIVDSEMIDLLQATRNLTRTPLYITSGYRCAVENRKVGGVYNSYHTKGKAFDTYSKDYDIITLAKIYQLLGASGILVYKKSRFVHVDNRIQKCLCYEETYSNVGTWLTFNEIKAVQKFLNGCAKSTKDNNYNCGEIDGIIGAKTIKSFKYFCDHYKYKKSRDKLFIHMGVM